MRCRRAREAIERRIDQRLGLERGFELDRHLQDCEACSSAWERARELDEGLARLAEPALQGLDVEAAIRRMRAAQADQTCTELGRRRSGRALLAPVAARLVAATLLVGVAVWRLFPAAPEIPLERELPSHVVEVAPVVVPAVLLPQVPLPQGTALEMERLERARGEVRAELLRASKLLSDGEWSAEAFALEVDSGTRALRQLEWPVLRLIERLLEDDEAALAGAAARYLGLRGDRCSQRQLAKALGRAKIAEQVTLALADCGSDGLAGLALALGQPAQRELASQLLIAMESPLAAEAVAATFALEQSSGAAEEKSDDLLETLVAMGPRALPALFGLGEHGWLSPSELCEWADGIPRLGSFLVQSLHEPRLSLEARRTRVRCAAVHAPLGAARWLVEHLHERAWQDYVLEVLPSVRGSAAVNALVTLDADSRITTRELDDLVRRTLDLDAARFVVAVREHEQDPSREWHTALAERLISTQSAAATPGVRVLLSSPQIDAPLRQELVLALGEHGDSSDLPLLAELFDACSEPQRQLAAACLIAIGQLGGEDALRSTLEGESPRTQSNLLSLLRRHKAGTRAAPSIYKLARELRPLLGARATHPRNPSS